MQQPYIVATVPASQGYKTTISNSTLELPRSDIKQNKIADSNQNIKSSIIE